MKTRCFQRCSRMFYKHRVFLLQWKMFTTFFKFANDKSKEFIIKIMFLVATCQNGRVLSLLYAPMFLANLKSKNDSTYLFGVVFSHTSACEFEKKKFFKMLRFDKIVSFFLHKSSY